MAIVRYRCVSALLAICGLLAAGAPAQADHRSAELLAFIDKYRCEIVVRMEQIRAHPRPKDRYLVLGLEKMPERYVQCIFIESDRRMLCEAASGFYAQRAGDPRRFAVPPDGLAALQRLGFSTDDSKGNFQRFIDTKGPADLAAVAELILAAFYEGYGARLGSKIELTAPLGPGGRAVRSRCMPIG